MSDLTESQKIALCAAAGIPYTPDSSAIVTHISGIREALIVRDAQLENIRQGVRRQALGILGLVGLSFDDLHAWVTKKEEKGR